MLACSVRTVEDYARAGKLPAVKFGDGWVFPVEAMLRAINRMAEDSAAQRSKTASCDAVAVSTQTRRRGPPALVALN
jgi:hypothetical protein